MMRRYHICGNAQFNKARDCDAVLKQGAETWKAPASSLALFLLQHYIWREIVGPSICLPSWLIQGWIGLAPGPVATGLGVRHFH